MSPDRLILDAFEDPAVDFISVGRTPAHGGYYASVKRAGRGYGVHHAASAAEALEKALAAPPVSPPDKAFAAAKAAYLPASTLDDFG